MKDPTNLKIQEAYYARPKSLYGSAQEARDEATIRQLGFEPIALNKPEIEAAVKASAVNPMEAFRPLVQRAKALFFRPFLDGAIGAGVAKEIEWAVAAGLPVVELPHFAGRRILTVDETRTYLSELGQR